MKTKIEIRLVGSPVYFLTSQGFQKGEIKTVHFLQNNKIEYRVTCKSFGKEYMGDLKVDSELFDSQEEMVAHYAKMKL